MAAKINDAGIRNVLTSMARDGRVTRPEMESVLRSAYDASRVTLTERADLQRILAEQSDSFTAPAKKALTEFLAALQPDGTHPQGSILLGQAETKKSGESPAPLDATEKRLRELWDKVLVTDPAAERARKDAEEKIAAKARAAAHRANVVAAENATTFAEWKALTPEQKAMVVPLHGSSKPQYVRTGLVDPATLAPGPIKDFAQKLLAQAREDIDLDIDPDPFATVGEPRWEVEIVSLASGEILGGNIAVRQDGAMIFDAADERSHYSSWEEADAAGAKEGDVNWNCFRAYDHDLKSVEGDSQLSWSGH